METNFPDDFGKFIKPSDFQDAEIKLVFLGWEKKANEDDSFDRKNAKTWKQKLLYQLRFSYPEYAVDATGEKILGNDGEPFINHYWDSNYSKGYTILYHFEQGQLESGSLPLFRAFCRVKPTPGEEIIISRSGKQQETKWTIRRLKSSVVSGVSKIQISEDELEPDSDVPF